MLPPDSGISDFLNPRLFKADGDCKVVEAVFCGLVPMRDRCFEVHSILGRFRASPRTRNSLLSCLGASLLSGTVSANTYIENCEWECSVRHEMSSEDELSFHDAEDGIPGVDPFGIANANSTVRALCLQYPCRDAQIKQLTELLSVRKSAYGRKQQRHVTDNYQAAHALHSYARHTRSHGNGQDSHNQRCPESPSDRPCNRSMQGVHHRTSPPGTDPGGQL